MNGEVGFVVPVVMLHVGEDGRVRFDDVVYAGLGFLEEAVDDAHAVADVEDAE